MLSFDEIEDCLPMGGGTTDDGSVIVSAQWLHDFAHAVSAKEREACKQAIRDTKDRSGTNYNGQNWLVRAGRSEFIAALDARSNVRVERRVVRQRLRSRRW